MTTGDSAAEAIAHPRAGGLELAGRARHGISSPLLSRHRHTRSVSLYIQAMTCRLHPTALPGGEPAALVDQPCGIPETGRAAGPVSLRLGRLGGRGGYRLLGAGEVGAADPDRG